MRSSSVFAAVAAVCMAGDAAFADSAKSISINFSGTRDSGLATRPRPYRPPMTLKDGATLDLSATNGCWSAKGRAATAGNNNRTGRTATGGG